MPHQLRDVLARLERAETSLERCVDYIVDRRTRRVGLADAMPEIVELTGLDEATIRKIAGDIE